MFSLSHPPYLIGLSFCICSGVFVACDRWVSSARSRPLLHLSRRPFWLLENFPQNEQFNQYNNSPITKGSFRSIWWTKSWDRYWSHRVPNIGSRCWLFRLSLLEGPSEKSRRISATI